jgi:anaerobic selenocysteine-containing dehydrogenase
VANLLIERNSVDMDFINEFTYGFQMLKSHVEKYTLFETASICGIGEDEIYSFVKLIENNRPVTLVSGYGLQRHKNGGQTIRALSILPALIGDVGVKGGGFRFANKQWRKLKWPFIPDSRFEIRDDYPAASLGRAVDSYKDPEVKMLWVERANPLTMNPDTNSLKKSIDKLEYIVVMDQFFTDTTAYADIVLPAQSFFEYDDLFAGYWTPYLSCCSKVIEPYYEAKNESEVYRMLGKRMGYDMRYLPEYNSEALDTILEYSDAGIRAEKLKESPYIGEGTGEIAFADRKFNTPSGKIELYSNAMLDKWGESPLPEYHEYAGDEKAKYPLSFLSTHARERIHSQFADIERLKGKDGRVLLYINPKDAENRNLQNDDMVEIYNNRGRIYAYVCITGLIKEGVVNVYEGLPERSGASVNMLTNQDSSDIGYGAVYYDCSVEVIKCRQ